MAGGFGNDDDEDVLAPKEPQVTSQDIEERKAARALRIKRRQEALKKAEQAAEESAVAEEVVGAIEQATATAAEELQRLSLDGAAKVTNVKVTTDEREVVRRTSLFAKFKDAYETIEEEAADAQIQYEAISANWDHLFSLKDPLDIDAEMKAQKAKCDNLLRQKDNLIARLKGELAQLDEDYYEDLQKQDNDIKELSERIEKQVSIMQKAYEEQLGIIEEAINIERDFMVDHNNKRWEALLKQRDREEVVHMEYRFEQLEEHKQIVDAIMWDHHEKYREAKIKLETLIQQLQQELEKLKANCIINAEKIGYTYQILKKREEENVFVRSEQKRKLNKMSDTANALRAKIRKAARDGAIEELKADAEIMKLMEAMDELEKKSNQFSHVNNYKFTQVWRMSSAKCLELSKQLRQGEVALHAHILAEPPPPPPPPPPKSPLRKYEKAHAAKKIKEEVETAKEQLDPTMAAAKETLIRHILQLVADNTGFLVENRLLTLIEKYNTSSRNLCTVDAIFMALEIEAEDDVDLLCNTFLTYSFCPICIDLDQSEVAQSASEDVSQDGVNKSDSASAFNKGTRQSMRGRPSMQRSVSASTSRSAHIGFKSHELSQEDQQLMTEADEILQKCGDPQATTVMVTGGTPDAGSLAGRRTGARGVTVTVEPTVTVKPTAGNRFLCPLGHHLEIEPMQVLTALSDFIAVFMPPEKKKLYDILENLKPPCFDTPSRELTPAEIDQYWLQWKNVFPLEKDKFWDGLLVGLSNYLNILQEREKVHEEVMQLRRRNADLRQLVRGAIPELPPVLPRYAQPYRRNFLSTLQDDAPSRHPKLPPI